MMPPILDCLRDRLEPGLGHVNSIADCAALSIAVSLKRIADVLVVRNDHGVCDLVQEFSQMLSDHKGGAR